MAKTAKLEIEYTYLTADEVAALQAEVREQKAWNTLTWGSFGREGKGPCKLRTLGELDTDHLEAILITQPCPHTHRAAILELLKIRYAAEQPDPVCGCGKTSEGTCPRCGQQMTPEKGACPKCWKVDCLTFEESSGYAGFRCNECGAWVYESEVK